MVNVLQSRATPLCTVRFGGTRVSSLIDTGADRSVIRYDVYRKIPKKFIVRTFKSADPPCVTATGDPLEVVVEAEIRFMIGRAALTHTFKAVKNLRKQLILGNDFMEANDADLSFKNRTLELKGKHFIRLGRYVRYQDESGRYAEPQCDRLDLPAVIQTPEGKPADKTKVKTTDNADAVKIKGEEIKQKRRVKNVSRRKKNYDLKEKLISASRSEVKKDMPVECPRLVWDTDGEDECPQLADISPETEPMIGGAYPDIGTSDLKTRQRIIQLLQENSHMFAANDLELGTTHLMQFRIDTGDHPPFRQRPYRPAWTQKKVLDEHLQNMLDAGVISPSCSPYASPVILVPKKQDPQTGKTDYRLCVDYRRLNSITTKNAAPLPNIADVLDSMEGSTVYSCLDLRQGFWQIPVAEEDKHKTAFITHKGLFEFNKVAFGLCNAPSAFVQLMNAALGDAQYNHVLAYLDDVVIHSKDLESHLEHLQDVFRRFESAGLRLKMSKCQFLKPEVSFLGHIVSQKGIHVSPEKIEAISNLDPPTNVRGVRGFLGMCSYYRKFLPHFADIARPLTNLTKKQEKFKWSKECQNAFDELKHGLATAPVLAFPTPERPFIVHTDASAFAIGAVLSQMDATGEKEQVVQYLSHKLSEQQCRWSASERECFAIVYALGKFRPYLLGSKFTLYTDHKPLSSLFVSSMKNARIQRWSVMLSEYDFEIKHKAGTKMVQADFLSRNPQPREQVEEAVVEDRYLPEIDEIIEPTCINCGMPYAEPQDPFLAVNLKSEEGYYFLCPACCDQTYDEEYGEDFEEEEYYGSEDWFKSEEPRSRWYDEDDDYYDAAEYVESEVEEESEEVVSKNEGETSQALRECDQEDQEVKSHLAGEDESLAFAFPSSGFYSPSLQFDEGMNLDDFTIRSDTYPDSEADEEEFFSSSESEVEEDVKQAEAFVDVVDMDQPGWKEMDDIAKGNTTLEEVTAEIQKTLTDIGYAQTKDQGLVDIRSSIDEGKENKHYVVVDDLLYHVGRPTVKDPEFRLQLAVPKQMVGLLLEAYHRPYHLGIDRTYALMHQRVHWDTMYHDVVLHCTRCLQCQRANLRKNRAPLQQRQLPAYPMQKIAMDTVGPLPESEEGYRYIVTLVCMFSGYVEAWPTKDKSAPNVARILLNEFIPRHSVPMTLMTDCGGEFMADIIDTIAANLVIHKISVSPYSPWSNGMVERCNGTIKRGLLKRIGEAKHDWPDHLPSVLMAMRVSVQESSRYSPFFLLYGRDATLPMDTLLRPKLKYTGEDWTTVQLGRMHEAFMMVKANTHAERDRQKKLYDRKAKPVKLEVGMEVWYHYPVVEKGVPAKLHQEWLPSYRIVKFTSPVTAVIRHQPSGETRPVHVNHLVPAVTNGAWDKEYEGPEFLANRRIHNPKRAAYEKEQEKRTRKQRIEQPLVGERRQPVRSCRITAHPYVEPMDTESETEDGNEENDNNNDNDPGNDKDDDHDNDNDEEDNDDDLGNGGNDDGESEDNNAPQIKSQEEDPKPQETARGDVDPRSENDSSAARTRPRGTVGPAQSTGTKVIDSSLAARTRPKGAVGPAQSAGSKVINSGSAARTRPRPATRGTLYRTEEVPDFRPAKRARVQGEKRPGEGTSFRAEATPQLPTKVSKQEIKEDEPMECEN